MPDLDPTQTMIGTAKGPGIWLAPEGTPAPAAGAAFTTPWKSLGYASDDGVTQGGDTTSEKFTPWQSTSPIRTVITEKSRTVQFIMWQLNEDTLGLYFDADPPTFTAGVASFDVTSTGGGHIYAIAIDVEDGANSIRFVYPRATLDSTGDMAITKSSMVPLDVTLSALDDAGVLMHIDITAGDGTLLSADVTTGERGRDEAAPAEAA